MRKRLSRLKGGGLARAAFPATVWNFVLSDVALHFAQAMEGCPSRWLLLSAGTDGIDGPTDAAGAIIDQSSLSRARALGLSSQAFLADNDSYSFFQQVGGLLRTGPTGTNVADVRLILLQDEGVT